MMPDLPNVDFERDIEQFVVSREKIFCLISQNEEKAANFPIFFKYYFRALYIRNRNSLKIPRSELMA